MNSKENTSPAETVVTVPTRDPHYFDAGRKGESGKH